MTVAGQAAVNYTYDDADRLTHITRSCPYQKLRWRSGDCT